MLNINNGFHWCIVNFCMKQSWLNEMGPRAGRAQQQCALSHRWLAVSHSLYSPCCTWNSPGRCSPVNACRWSPGETSGLPMWLPGPADREQLKVCPAKGSRSNGTSQSSVSVLDLLSGVGGGPWGEERRERAGIQARELCVFSSWMCLFICQTFSSRSCLNTTWGLSVGVWSFHNHLNRPPHDPQGPAGGVGEQSAPAQPCVWMREASARCQIMVA